MAELLVKALDAVHADPVKDRRGCYKRGYVVVVMPDDHPWGAAERRPLFVLIKVPTISVARVQKYLQPLNDVLSLDPPPPAIQRRRWRIRWADLPQLAKDLLANTGQLVIRAGSYTGPADYTWDQVKAFFRDDATGLDETEAL